MWILMFVAMAVSFGGARLLFLAKPSWARAIGLVMMAGGVVMIFVIAALSAK